jgi:hypothetical protein
MKKSFGTTASLLFLKEIHVSQSCPYDHFSSFPSITGVLDSLRKSQQSTTLFNISAM